MNTTRNPLFIMQLTLMGFGLIQVFSTSFIFAQDQLGWGYYFFSKQVLFSVLGLLITLGIGQLSMSKIIKYSWLLWPMAIFLVALTFIPGLGIKVGGATRWLNLFGGLRFEPSELLKIAACFWVSSLFNQEQIPVLQVMPTLAKGLLTVTGMGMLLFQPDFGSFVIIFLIYFLLLFYQGLRWKWIILSCGASVLAFVSLILMAPYRKQRILTFLDPWLDPQGHGYQMIQSMMTFSQGGLWGEGLGQGQGKLFFLPEAHTDFTFAVLGEELGLWGAWGLLALYFAIVAQGLKIVQNKQNQFQKQVALALTLLFALSTLINIGMVLGMLPTKGLTLPFLSYGGSSLLVMSLLMGVLIKLQEE